ncbi:MAG: hypothetical protein ABIS45_16205 [Burkholderiales bacterium]
MSFRRLIAVVSLFLFSIFSQQSFAANDAPADLVLVRQGTLPVILTAPHGGRQAVPGIEERNIEGKPGGKGAKYVKGADTNTDILALRIADEIERITGRTPYIVMAKFARKYIDANRSPEIAMDDARARPYYDTYHNAVRQIIAEIRGKYPAGLLIDVHGQHFVPDVVMRGTHNGKSVTRLLQRAGFDAVTGPNGIFGQIEANGFKVFPGNDLPPRGKYEDAGLNGGYTVATYGSDTVDGIDAVQMEFGSNYRAKAALDKSGKDAGKAIAAFYEAYLKKSEK